MSQITVFKEYQYNRNSTGNFHRILNGSDYAELLEFYRSTIYLGGKFWAASILDRSDIELRDLAQKDIDHARERLDTLADLSIPIETAPRTIDLGCGCGAFLFLSERRWSGTPEGIDISNIAKSMSARLWPKTLKIREGEILQALRNSPPDYGAYDVVAAFDIIEHIWDLDSAVQLIHTLLKPYGLCFVEVPVISSHWSWEQVTDFRLFHPHHHLHLFTPLGITSLFAKTNFTVKCSTFLRGDRSKYLIVFEKQAHGESS